MTYDNDPDYDPRLRLGERLGRGPGERLYVRLGPYTDAVLNRLFEHFRLVAVFGIGLWQDDTYDNR